MILSVFMGISAGPITLALRPWLEGTAAFSPDMLLSVIMIAFSGVLSATVARQNLGLGFGVQGLTIGAGLSVTFFRVAISDGGVSRYLAN